MPQYNLIKDDVIVNSIIATPDVAKSLETEYDSVEEFFYPEVSIVPEDILVSPVQFKLLWTMDERVALNQLESTDLIIKDFFDILSDPKLESINLSLQTTKDTVNYFLNKLLDEGVLTQEMIETRREQILSGIQI